MSDVNEKKKKKMMKQPPPRLAEEEEADQGGEKSTSGKATCGKVSKETDCDDDEYKFQGCEWFDKILRCEEIE